MTTNTQIPEISVIISTYNAEKWLEKVLWGYQQQTCKDFELLIADDGSNHKTLDLINSVRTQVDYPIIHVWQEDNGFQKSQILNKALLQCTASYIVMSDGDCIPRKDFLEIHKNLRKKGYFLSGGYFKLPMSISEAITKEDIFQQRCFDINWLKKNGLSTSFKNNKLTSKGFIAKLLNFLTPTNASWNGHNSSGWKKDLVEINGFNQEMQYGGQDRELGERLFNLGLKSKQIRYSAICVHLDHKRGYVNEETWKKNNAIRKNTRDNKVVKTPIGIDSNI